MDCNSPSLFAETSVQGSGQGIASLQVTKEGKRERKEKEAESCSYYTVIVIVHHTFWKCDVACHCYITFIHCRAISIYQYNITLV